MISKQPSRRPVYDTWLIVGLFMSRGSWKSSATDLPFGIEDDTRSLKKE